MDRGEEGQAGGGRDVYLHIFLKTALCPRTYLLTARLLHRNTLQFEIQFRFAEGQGSPKFSGVQLLSFDKIFVAACRSTGVKQTEPANHCNSSLT